MEENSNVERQETPEEQEQRLQERSRELALEIEGKSLPMAQTDDFKAEHASNNGGFELRDDELLSRHRSVIVDMLAQVGRKVLNGEFDLTRVSFPIRCMSHDTALKIIADNFSTIPFYYSKASKLADDPVERMKMIICSDISCVIYNKSFEKPLNPILGETYKARGQDGAHVYCEQISHHPPISSFSYEHPDYKMEGSMQWAIRAGIQSADVQYLGQRKVTFPDGGEITYDVGKDKIYGLFMGVFGHQRIGREEFKDEQNGLTAYVDFGAYMFKRQDYCYGEIKRDGKRVCEITGNYVGHLDFDGVRYWDYREGDAVHTPLEQCVTYLPSDARERTDGIFLKTRPIEEAQAEKERLENIQRNDKKLRAECNSRREAGGAKYK